MSSASRLTNPAASLAAVASWVCVAFEELVFPDEIHDFLRYATWLVVSRAATDFLLRELQSPKP